MTDPAQLPPSWRDHEDRPTQRPRPPGGDSRPFYVPIGEFQGTDYRRNAFAQGTRAEVVALRERLGLSSGMRVLDVGCADGRHLRALAGEGVTGLGVDVSPALVVAARSAARAAGRSEVSFVTGDARSLLDVPEVEPGAFDVVLSLCQGGLGTSPDTDPVVLDGMAAAARRGGTVVFTLFHALFGARHLAPGDAYDVVHGVHHQVSEVRGPDHAAARFDLWTSAYTVQGACRLAGDAGLEVREVVGVEPGHYAGSGVALDDPELLVVAVRP